MRTAPWSLLHWTIEVGNALLKCDAPPSYRAGQQRNSAITQLIDLQITIDRETLDRLWTTTLALSDRYSLTLYDACYLELAQQRKVRSPRSMRTYAKPRERRV